MDIPFALHFLKKIELFQVLNKLDKQYFKQLKSNSDNLPLWHCEMKILYWSYKNHKHLGSPLFIDDLRTKKSFMLKEYNNTDSQQEKIYNQIKIIDANDFEINYKNYLKTIIDPDVKNGLDKYYGDKINGNKIGSKITDIYFSSKEIEKIKGVRKTFGNLVARNFAYYYPEIQEAFDHWEKTGPNMSETRNKNVPVDQDNCDGILINSNGLLMGELINNVYIIKKTENIHFNKKPLNKTSSSYSLTKKLYWWYFYKSIIILSYGALAIVLFFIIENLWKILGLPYFCNSLTDCGNKLFQIIVH